MKKRILALLIVAITVISLSGCGTSSKTEGTADTANADRETLFQVSLLQGLTFGDYNGSITAAQLKEKGDTGLGTFDALDGEMIVLDGAIYKAKSDGSVELVDDEETIPFSNVTFFDEDENQEIENLADIDELKSLLDEKMAENGGNGFCVIKIDGIFKEMNVRSEYEQQEPYKPLATVLETDQTFFDYSDIEGTVVGLYCPQYMDKLNAAGWHLHFISKDKEKGGHVLGLSVESAELGLDYTPGFEMQLPDNEMFNGFDLTIDQSDDIKKVEIGDDAFSLWVQDAESLAALKEYVEDVTDESSEHFIPEEDRVAAFDMDGTLYGELAPIYVEWWMYAYRVNEDSSFTPDEEEKAVADQIVEAAKTGIIPENVEMEHAVQNARVYAGMTVEGYCQYVREFLKRDVVGFENMTYKDAFYKPMIQVVNYLNDNGFTIYICSGTDRFMCREVVNGVLPIADNNFIGMDVMLKARGQGDADGLDYTYASDDQVVRTDELLIKNVKMNKVSMLSRELGKPPVLCFGNSSGDESMGVYTTENNPYYSKTFMLIADDDVRDYGDPAKAEEKRAKWESHGWEVISMKNDWTTIYGEEVIRK